MNWLARFVADLDNATSQTLPPQVNRGDPPHHAHPPTTEGVASDSGPARHSVADPPPPRRFKNPMAEVSPSQKGKVTQALNSKIATEHHNPLRAAFGAERVEGAWKLIEAISRLDAKDIPGFLTQHGITPASDLPDDPGAAPADSELAGMGLSPVED